MLFRKPVFASLLCLSVFLWSPAGQSAPPDQARQAELGSILYQDCGSCHGMTLKGGLGPALTPQALQNKTRDYLRQTIHEGHQGTPMPPWKYILTPEEIEYLVDLLKPKDTPS